MNKMDKVKTGLEIHLIHIGDDQCVRCPYKDAGSVCCEDLFRDTMELLTANMPTLPGMRFTTTTGDLFTVTEISGPSCTVKQERTGYTYRYETAALLKLPVTWEGGPTNEKV